MTAHHRVTGPIVLATFRQTVAEHGIPASTLTDNGMVFTTRLSQGKKGAGTRNGFETELRRLGIVQKNSTPGHPTTCGKVERFQQTMKKWLRGQPDQPTTIDDLQALLDAFVEEYNDHRPHRSLEHRATPATVYTTRPKATPPPATATTTPTTASATTRSTRPARSPGATRARCTPSASAEPTPEPASSSSPKTSRSASSTPPPANSSASSPSTHPSATKAPDAHPAPPAETKEGRTHVYWVRPSGMS